MWYTGLDFERFKNELLIEARNAGCMSGRECYDHIRRKFQDEATLNNTRMNVVQVRLANSQPPVQTNLVLLYLDLDASDTIKKRRKKKRIEFLKKGNK